MTKYNSPDDDLNALWVKKPAANPQFTTTIMLVVYTKLVYTSPMLKNITLSADEVLIREARRQAALQNTTLNALFREWLEQYVAKDESARKEAVRQYDELMKRLSHVNAGRKFTREEMNERR